MLNDLRRLFRQSLDAFRSELSTREPEDQVAELLTAMRRELVAARAALPEYEAEVRRAGAELARERQALDDCDRRARLAERIGDRETMEVARGFAERHRERVAVLEQKVMASEAELDLRRREAEEMARRYKEADANRFGLLAQLRSSMARERMRVNLEGSEGPMADWTRMEERVADEAAYVDALEELDGHEQERGKPPPDTETLEERLRELKRRMGKE